MGLVRVFCDIAQVQPECLTQATKLDLALMLQAELERLLRYLLVENERLRRPTELCVRT